MAKIQAVWALDVGQAALKALKLVPGETDEKVVAEAFDYVEYPKILSQPDADADQLVREALGTFLERNDLKGCRVAIAVPGQAGLVKFIKLPPVEKKRIPDIVKFEARQQIPFALEEVIWDYQQIGDQDEGADEEFTMAEVGLFAMKRDQINRAILPFTVAGIEVDVVQMGPIALYNYVTYDRLKGSEKGAEKGSVVLLDIGADNTDLIISDGSRIWQRNVPIGGNHFTRALTKELKLTFAKGEHLKRNATKAPDPRAVFTAMRSVFNDLASEINRSIGFYSSVNRSAKILKIVGMGNGFKLPGLQKFLQQNLSYDVEKLDGFARITGDDVLSAPQFQENLPSFAVAYGLALQGLGISQLRTNLLPPEIEQVRMIRRKKPWVLAASVLLMIGFTSMFLGDWKLWAKVTAQPIQDAAKFAKQVTSDGAGFQSAFETAKGEWTAEKGVGDKLVVDTTEQARWPLVLQRVNAFLPNLVNQEVPVDAKTKLKLDPNDPKAAEALDRLQVHIDAFKPVYRADLGAEWFDTLSEMSKTFMHPYDRANKPSGEGWVIQLIGHHYNPNPKKGSPLYERGPLSFIAHIVLPTLWSPQLRQFGITHATVTWLHSDKAWTSEKELASNGLPSDVPLLPKAQPAKGAGGNMMMSGMDSSGYGSGMSGSSGMGSMMAGGYSGGSGMDSGGYGSSAMPGMMPGGMMPGGGGYGMPGGANAADAKLTKLTRTDFLIQLAWRPLKPDETPKDLKEIDAELRKAFEAAGKGAIPQASSAEEEKIEKASSEQSKRARAAIETAAKKAAGKATGAPGAPAEGAPGAPAAAAVPGAPAAPGAPATPPGPGAAAPPEAAPK